MSHVGLFKEFVKFAEACHAYGQLVERPTEIKEALKNAFDSSRPSTIDPRIDPDEVPAGALERFETLVKKHPELGEKRIPTTTFPKKQRREKPLCAERRRGTKRLRNRTATTLCARPLHKAPR